MKTKWKHFRKILSWEWQILIEIYAFNKVFIKNMFIQYISPAPLIRNGFCIFPGIDRKVEMTDI